MPYELTYRSPHEYDNGSEEHEIRMPELVRRFEAQSDEEAIVHAKEILKDGALTYRGQTYHREAMSLTFIEQRTIPLD